MESHEIIYHATFLAPTDNSEPNCLFTNLDIFIRIALQFSLTLANFQDSKSTCLSDRGVEDGDDDGGDVQSYPRQWVGQRPRLSINCVAQPALI